MNIQPLSPNTIQRLYSSPSASGETKIRFGNETETASTPTLNQAQLDTLSGLYGDKTGVELLLAIRPKGYFRKSPAVDGLLRLHLFAKPENQEPIKKGLEELAKNGFIELNKDEDKTNGKTRAVLTELGQKIRNRFKEEAKTNWQFRHYQKQFKKAIPDAHISKVNIQYTKHHAEEVSKKLAELEAGEKKLVEESVKIRTLLGGTAEQQIQALKTGDDGKSTPERESTLFSLGNFMMANTHINQEGTYTPPKDGSLQSDKSFKPDKQAEPLVAHIISHRKLESEFDKLSKEKRQVKYDHDAWQTANQHWQKLNKQAHATIAGFKSLIAELAKK